MTLPGPGQPAYQVVDPATGDPVRSIPHATDAEAVDTAVHPPLASRAAEHLAIATPYGLGAAVFSTPSTDGPELPLSGVKRSGFSRELGPGIGEFVNGKLVCTAVQPHA